MGDAACHRPRASTTVKVGPYVLKKVIGRGNFAVVKLGKHEVTKTKVAVKIVDKCRIDEDNLRKIYREIQILKCLRHPHIVRLYQVMETESKLYLVTEYASGGEVFEYLQKHGRMNERQARRIFRQTVSAIVYCHMSGIVHRDLKAENLLLDEENIVKLVDFGFSNFYDSGQLLSTWCGSPPYAAPELFLGENYDGTKADVWSLGVVLYILVSGGFPFPSNSIERLKQAVILGHVNIPFYVSVECADLIRKMLVVDPAQRFSVRQVIQHKWFMADDWNERWQSLFNDSLSPRIIGGPRTNDLNPTVIIFMQQKGYNADKVAEAVLEKRFDEEYAAYHLLCDKLVTDKSRVKQIINDAVLETCDLPRRGSRGSLTTGQATCEPMAEANTILASDLVKLSVASLDQNSHTSDSDEGSSGETTPYNLHAYLSTRRHTALGVPGLTTTAAGFPAPPVLSTASGHIGVPFPLAFGLGEVSNLANASGVPNCLLPPLFKPDVMKVAYSNTGRRGSDGATGIPPGLEFTAGTPIGPAISAAAFLNPASATGINQAGCPPSLYLRCLQPPPVRFVGQPPAASDANGGDESIEEAGARYLRVRASSKRHTVHGQLSTGMVGTNGPNASAFSRQISPLAGGSHHSSRHSSRGEPYRPLASHRRASDSTQQITPSLLTHLERLYNQATHRPESPAGGGEGMWQLQQEFQQLRANTELTQQQLLQSSASEQPRRSPRSSPPGQSLDMIIEHDMESSALGRSPPGVARLMGDAEQYHLQQLGLQSATPQINVTDDRGTTIVHQSTDSAPSLTAMPPFVANNASGHFAKAFEVGSTAAMRTTADPISNFQYFAQDLLCSGGAYCAPAEQQTYLNSVLLQQQLQQQLLANASTHEYYHNSFTVGSPCPADCYGQPQQGDNYLIHSKMSNNNEDEEERELNCDYIEDSIFLPPTRSVSGIVFDLKQALDQLKIAYTDTDPPLGPSPGRGRTGEPHARRVSLEGEDGTRVEIGIAQMDKQTGFNKVDFRCVQGDYNRYKQLCKRVLSALRW